MKLILEPCAFNNQYLWKYLDIHKFLYFLNEKSIYFARSDQFEDPNEGLPESIIRRIYEHETFPVEENLNPRLFPNRKEAIFKNKKNLDILKTDADEIQRAQYISCWFLGERESYSMWNIYSNSDSVALRFNPSDLIDNINKSLHDFSSDFWIENVFGGLVNYQQVYPPEYDGSKYTPPTNKLTALKKDLSYSSESEYRFIGIANNSYSENLKFELKIENLYSLDFHILTHPKMEVWMYKNILSILKNFGLEKHLIKSEIKLRSNL
jgi:hypothetical protein